MAKRRTASPENKLIAKRILHAFGGTPEVREYLHDTVKLAVDIVSCVDRPSKGLISYSTIRLSDYPMLTEDRSEFPTRVELAGVCTTDKRRFPNVLASAAFCIMRTNRLAYPGSVLPDYVREYYKKTKLPHLYLTSPFVWEDRLQVLDCGSKQVRWLLALPISQKEMKYLQERGEEALERLFEVAELDFSNLDRAPALQ